MKQGEQRHHLLVVVGLCLLLIQLPLISQPPQQLPAPLQHGLPVLRSKRRMRLAGIMQTPGHTTTTALHELLLYFLVHMLKRFDETAAEDDGLGPDGDVGSADSTAR